MKNQGFSRSEADHCAYYKRFEDANFIMFLLYVDDMLVASPNMKKIFDLRDQLARNFKLKDLGATNQILGMKIQMDKIGWKI